MLEQAKSEIPNDTAVKITVLMPVHNTEKYVAEAVSSILRQTFKEFELLVINDGSTDKSMDIMRAFNDHRIRIVDQSKAGIAAALNNGIQLARGTFIARFDADDICYPHRLEEQYNFLTQNPDYILVGSDVDYIDSEGKFLFHYGNKSRSDDEIRAAIDLRCPLIHSTVCYNASIVRQLGGYNTRAHTFEDYFLWTKLIHHGKVMNLAKPLISVRLNPESLSVDEKLRGKKFLSLRKQILFQSGQITLSQEQKLLKILHGQNSAGFKRYSYHILVAKKYLWDNHRPAEARQHLRKAIAFRPFSSIAYSLILLSLAPKRFVNRIYKTYKMTFSN